MKKLKLYPSFKVKSMDFSKTKRMVVPNQSMTLQDIIRRFTRNESLPIEKRGVYEDRFGDLDKLSREDISVKAERAVQLKNWAVDHEAKLKAEAQRLEAERFAKEVKDRPAGSQGAPPQEK